MTTEAGMEMGRAIPAERDGGLSPASVERLHAYFVEGCPEPVRPALESVLADARLRAVGVRRPRGRRRPRLGGVRSGSGRRARVRARARRGRRSRRRRSGCRGVRSPAGGRPSGPVQPDGWNPAAPGATAPPRRRDPTQADARPRSLHGGLALASHGRRDRELLVLGNADEPSRRVRAEAKAVLRGRTRLSLLGGSSFRSAAVVRFGQPYAAGRRPARERRARGRGRLHGRGRCEPQPGRRARAAPRVLGAARGHAHRSGGTTSCAWDSISTTARFRTCSRSRPTFGSSAAGLPVRPRGLSGAGVRPVRRPDVTADGARPRARASSLTRSRRKASSAALSARSSIAKSRPSASEAASTARSRFAATPTRSRRPQRITVFRAIQEALANIREHSGATSVVVRMRARRSAIEVQISDDGMGFEVERALPKAAQRGRLGLVGIAERVRMVGGTFQLESSPGGPTTLKRHFHARKPSWRGQASA